MSAPKVAPYGSWTSPVTAELAAADVGFASWVGAVGDDVWWTEPRPSEAGRSALVRRRPGGRPEVVLPAPWNVRSRLMEYGGRPWAGALDRDGQPLVAFVDFADQRVHRLSPDAVDAAPTALTPAPAGPGTPRYADLEVRPERGEMWCVREEVTGPAPQDRRRTLVAVPLYGSAADAPDRVRVLGGDTRFLTGPRLSPDGRRVAWLGWDHPSMPWDGTVLRVADVAADGTFTDARTVAGGPDESVVQVEWADPGALLAVTDRTGWWNLHRIDPDSGDATNLCPREEEFGGALWEIGFRWFAPLPDGRIAVLHGRGAQRLGLLDPATGQLTDTTGPWTEWAGWCPSLAVTDDAVLCLAGAPDRPFEVVGTDLRTGHSETVGLPHRPAVDQAYLPQPVRRTVPGPGGREVHATLYLPRNPDHTAPDGDLPPCVVRVHGGPTSRAMLVQDLELAYFTSRGLAVVDVDYGGSTGHGRVYRNRLRGKWGVVDVEDCAAVTEALVAEGVTGPDRLAVRGGSAGGWTSAASLTFTDTYRCAVIKFPVLDLTTWADGETHDFESRYLDSLVGPLPEAADRYRDRSPLHHTDQLTAPFLLLQGLDDEICPPAQCERLLARLGDRPVPHAYLAFEGEQHGFRRADTVVTCLHAELSLYAQVFGFAHPDVPRLALS